MMTLDLRQLVFVLGAVIVAAAIQDLLSRRISNLFPLAIVALFLGANTLAGWRIDVWQNILSFLLIFIAGSLLFKRGVLGGGDVKLWAAVALWFNLTQLPLLILSISLAGGVLAVLSLLKALLRKKGGGISSWKRARSVPYGVAIALGTMLTISASGIGVKSASVPPPEYQKLNTSLMNTVR